MIEQVALMMCGTPCNHNFWYYDQLLVTNMITVAAVMGLASGGLVAFHKLFRKDKKQAIA